MLGKACKIFIALLISLCSRELKAQAPADSIIFTPGGNVIGKQAVKKIKDTSVHYNPNKAVIRSAIVPGWGQITNKKYWKLPLVYGALGVTAGILVHNIKQYRGAKKAYALAVDGDASNDYLIEQPYYSVKDQPERIRTFRNQVRQNVDYSVLFFLIFWGLNVADAAVDAHLKTFDVSDNLGLQIKPGYSPMANTNGVSLLLTIK